MSMIGPVQSRCHEGSPVGMNGMNNERKQLRLKSSHYAKSQNRNRWTIWRNIAVVSVEEHNSFWKFTVYTTSVVSTDLWAISALYASPSLIRSGTVTSCFVWSRVYVIGCRRLNIGTCVCRRFVVEQHSSTVSFSVPLKLYIDDSVDPTDLASIRHSPLTRCHNSDISVEDTV